MATDDIILRTEVSPFPPGYCPASQQQFADDVADALQVFFPAEFTPIIKSPNQPTVEQRGYTWNKVDASTGMSVGYFEWSVVIGAWAKNHWNGGVVPFDERRLFVGSALDAETYDGGSPGTVSSSTGPFWEIDHDLDNRIVIGAATVPVGTSANTQVGADGAKTEVWGMFYLKPTGRQLDVAT